MNKTRVGSNLRDRLPLPWLRVAWLRVPAILLVLLIAHAATAREPAGDAGGRAQHRGADAGSIPIAAGEATLGSDAAEKSFGYKHGGEGARRGKWFDHEPRRQVNLPTYWMDATLVTQRAYGEFLRATNHRRPFITRREYRAQGFLVHPYEEVLPFLWFSEVPVGWLEAHPVNLVDVADAGAFCSWRGKQEGRNCRLPTENEWEKAARGGGGRYYAWGNQWEPGRLNSAERGPYTTTPVRRYPQGRSFYGLYDMGGNLFQWTATPGRPGRNILKGCSWDDAGGICRAAARHDRPVGSRHILIGFRCVCQSARVTTTENCRVNE